ncbi:hypothetical protein SLS62_000451 [Diatrype stigma]|uniref:GH16 domain-containing protein n=1 Tax=Diatrype stigma TaxID=117547 RepID=A0AAN9V0T5_9PEZI
MVKLSILLIPAVVCGVIQSASTTNDTNELDKPVRVPARPPGYSKTVFYDDFTAQTLDITKWKYDIGTAYPGGPAHWGTGEVQTYTNSANNIFITSANTLRIIPLKEASGVWTSARIETTAAYDMACPAGGRLRVQAHIKVGAAGAAARTEDGIWSAFWMIGSAIRSNYRNWPEVGEIDILESVNGAARDYQTVHCGTARGGVCNESKGVGGSSGMARGQWHVVQLDIDRAAGGAWTDESLTWSLDGVETLRIRPGDLQGDPAAWNALAATAKMILLNVAVGGTFPDSDAGYATPNANTVGGGDAGMEVDYVIVWST